MNIEYPEHATPIDPNEITGLIPSHISTRAELDRCEQDNILEAEAWLSQRRPRNAISDAFIRRLHERMFNRVWKWAGRYRLTNKNLGVDHWKISVEIRNLCDDANLWIEDGTYWPDEIAARLHHRLVSVHPFANGNGRHARLMADVMLEHVLNRKRFTWGSAVIQHEGECRKHYIAALKAADNHDYDLLMRFVRS